VVTISRVKRITVRNVWKDEEADFTPWLKENIDLLEELLGIKISVVEREASVGEFFRADLLAEGPNGDRIVIENQFGKSNHDHLGKLLVYLTNLEAKIGIWICEYPQPEHVQAIEWLNENSPSDVFFYLIKLEVLQIEDSHPAPYLSIVAGPSEQIKEAGVIKKEITATQQKRREFWGQLLEKSSAKTELFSTVSPSTESWIYTGAGKTGLGYVHVVLKNSARIELYIDTGDADKNKKIFDKLCERKEEIERDFGDKLEWQRLDTKRASRIAKTIEKTRGLENEDDWPTIQEKMIDTMIRFENALSKYLTQLKYAAFENTS